MPVASYSDLGVAVAAFPGAIELVLDENRQQHPEARFVVATIGPSSDPGEAAKGWAELVALFDVGCPGELLFVNVYGDLADPDGVPGAFIDEYSVFPEADARRWLALVGTLS
jgi:hypothetical protein